MKSPDSSPFGGAAATEAPDDVFFFEFGENAADHVTTDDWAGLFEDFRGLLLVELLASLMLNSSTMRGGMTRAER